MQSSSSTIALQSLRSQWSLDADDYRIHSKNHYKLYPPPHAKLSHLKSIIRWPRKSSPPTWLPYHIGDPIFFEGSFIPYAFVDFIDSDNYNSVRRKECVMEFPATVPAETSVPTVQLWVHRSRQCDHAQPQHVSRWVRSKAKLCSYSCCWSKWLIQLTHLGAVEEIVEVSLVEVPIVLLYHLSKIKRNKKRHLHITCLSFILFPF